MLKINVYRKVLIIFITASSIFTSCEDVITVNLNGTSSRLVIQGSISNISDSVIIKLHKSTDYFKPVGIVSVTDAQVSITDPQGNAYQLSGGENGFYFVNNISAMPGDVFTLDVITDGVHYPATAKMPFLVRIDSLFIDKRPTRLSENRINIVFSDPAGIPNYYQVKVYRNNILLKDNYNYRLYSDKYFDGKINTITLNARRFDIPRFEFNDVIKVQLINIDKGMYNYYQILGDITSGANFMSASTPSNPPNNLSNDALGYFAAWSVNEKVVILK